MHAPERSLSGCNGPHLTGHCYWAAEAQGSCLSANRGNQHTISGFGNCNKQLLLSKFDRFPTDLQDKPHDMLPKTWSCQGQILTPGRCLLHMSLLSFLLYCNCQEKLSFGISVVIWFTYECVGLWGYSTNNGVASLYLSRSSDRFNGGISTWMVLQEFSAMDMCLLFSYKIASLFVLGGLDTKCLMTLGLSSYCLLC